MGKLFAEKLGCEYTDDPAVLATIAKKILRQEFLSAQAGISGANFAVADSGSIVLFTNEGNGRMCTTVPPLHIAVLSIEKMVPSLADLPKFIRLLPRSATGQVLSSYMSVITGTRKSGETTGAPGNAHRPAGQRPLEDRYRQISGNAEVHSMRRLPERLSRVPYGGWARLPIDVSGTHGNSLDHSAGRNGKGPSSPGRDHPLRRMRRRLPREGAAPRPSSQVARKSAWKKVLLPSSNKSAWLLSDRSPNHQPFFIWARPPRLLCGPSPQRSERREGSNGLSRPAAKTFRERVS